MQCADIRTLAPSAETIVEALSSAKFKYTNY